jgi:rsbT co-antagonist protein RsbR
MSDKDRPDDMPERIAEIAAALSSIGRGEYEIRWKDPILKDHPLFALYSGVDQMIAGLESDRRRGGAHRKELEEKLAMIELQRAAIRELSTPIMEVWAGVLCLPVIGVLDSSRSSEMMETLLRAVVEKKARYTIIDITGIQVMDTATADHFIRMAKAVRLIGADCALTGINPSIAQTIVHMGVELSGVAMHRSLRSALQQYVVRLEAGAT